MKTKTKLKRKNKKTIENENEKIENENENAKTAKLVTMRRLRVLRPYSVESVTNGGRYLGRSSTCLRQQV